MTHRRGRFQTQRLLGLATREGNVRKTTQAGCKSQSVVKRATLFDGFRQIRPRLRNVACVGSQLAAYDQEVDSMVAVACGPAAGESLFGVVKAGGPVTHGRLDNRQHVQRKHLRLRTAHLVGQCETLL
jgi:hypothetical protein